MIIEYENMDTYSEDPSKQKVIFENLSLIRIFTYYYNS